ncbi:hypothetical protein D6833_01065 [Candidatus Parcubacteria bacterium]|nr:MAG: hypothetical protein D6833_01065 [Candidatus Parcubacteria bacterium]
MRGGIDGYAYGLRSTWELVRNTGSSLVRGDWEGVRRYGGALLEGVVKGWVWGGIRTAVQLAWGAVKMSTPIGLFETVPAWWHAIQDARAGKRGGWDVALTSLFLAANLLGIYGGVNYGVKTANEFRAFSDTLSPAAQSQYISLNTLEQFRLFRTVRAVDAPPEAVEFYLEQTARPGSPLGELPMAEALRVSTLARQAVQNPQAEAVLIGKYFKNSSLSYEQLGEDLTYTHLNLKEPYWGEFKGIVSEYNLGEGTWWELVNRPFIEEVAQSGKPVYVNVNPEDPVAFGTGNLHSEIQLLQEFGYELVSEQPVTVNGVELWIMMPPK